MAAPVAAPFDYQTEMSVLIIGIHGVGNPSPLVLEAELQATLKHENVDVPVREINWNQIVEYPVVGDNVSGTALLDLVTRMARASLWDWESSSTSHMWLRRITSTIRAFSYFGAELAVALFFMTLVWIIPVSFVLDFLEAQDPHAHARIIAFMLLHLLPRIVVFCLIVFLASGLTLVLLERNLAPGWITLRKALLVLVRPLLLGTYAVMLIHWRSIRDLLLSILMLLAFVASAVTIIYTVRWHHISLILSGAVLLLAVPYLLNYCSRDIGGAVLKVLLDIFHYISDPAYRVRIQEFVDHCVEELCHRFEPTEVVLVGHSLGSVIIVDSLLHSHKWLDKRITLITVGSPLRRFFFRFFPGLYIPATAGKCADDIARRLREFRWINAYRRLDYIG